ncbi:MAG TPA: HPF/RaiA family ribosome-associated protein [Stellaceae bacterium]|nr:HPF/RaiA family ribosome-associated protein [Stellaceae bacterium]
MDASPALEARIRQRAEELEQYYNRIIACHVTVEARHRHHRQGNLFQVSIDLLVPGREIAVSSGRDSDHAHEDAHVAVRDAFDALRRRLEDHVREARGKAKLHVVPDHGRVARLLPDRDGGFIVTPSGAEIYFHRNSVADGGFDALETGAEVRFVVRDRESANGPQASTVVPLGKRHPPPAETVRG